MVKPEMLICAVGTKVYSRGDEKKEEMWIEDEEWTRTLDVGWDEAIVRAGCAKAIELCGEESAHFRPEEEQNAHKITCALKDENVGEFVARVGEIFGRKERDGKNNQFRHGRVEVRGLRVESSREAGKFRVCEKEVRLRVGANGSVRR